MIYFFVIYLNIVLYIYIFLIHSLVFSEREAYPYYCFYSFNLSKGLDPAQVGPRLGEIKLKVEFAENPAENYTCLVFLNKNNLLEMHSDGTIKKKD